MEWNIAMNSLQSKNLTLQKVTVGSENSFRKEQSLNQWFNPFYGCTVQARHRNTRKTAQQSAHHRVPLNLTITNRRHHWFTAFLWWDTGNSCLSRNIFVASFNENNKPALVSRRFTHLRFPWKQNWMREQKQKTL